MDLNPHLFFVTQPGLEAPLADEAQTLGFSGIRAVAGGVEADGDLQEAIRANLYLRGATRILLRIAAFRAMHLAQLDKRGRKVPWGDWLLPETPVRVEATCRRSKIYHKKAASQRIERILRDLGIPISADAVVVVKLRIEDDLCTLSLDTTGAALHQRGHKTFVGKAPLRETMAAGFLREMGFDGSQAVVDPMCGSGTIILEAAEIAAGLVPGRSRAFAFEALDEAVRPEICAAEVPVPSTVRFTGFDRDAGAVRGATENAKRAGVSDRVQFGQQAVSDLQPPEGPSGIVLTNPPYGARIGNRKLLFGLYGALGAVLRERFAGWDVGIVTSDGGLAKATGLLLESFGPVDHSGTKVSLWRAKI